MPESARPPMHIGFLAKDFLSWPGGVWFIQNLLCGLASMPPHMLRVTIFVPSDSTPRVLLRRFAKRLRQAAAQPSRAVSTLKAPSPERALWKLGVAKLTALVPDMVVYGGSEADLVRCCRSAKVDVLMPVMTPLASTAIPWVGYLYDCQHKHHPEFFSAAQRGVRDRAFALMLSRASVVFANAKAVVSDLQGFFPGGRAKLFSLPFAPLVGDEELARVAEDARQARQRTHGADYFIVCNQFWIHKDHATAFRAFARFVHGPASGNHRLVCTGLTEDCRVPGHFDRLKALVKELGIAERVDFTGYIDRAEQLALVHGSTALLQPTLFEGGPGGGAASDAIALGVPCILSDIPVNREVIHPFASFFRVGDPNSLADAMQRTVATPPQRPAIEILAAANRRHTYALGESLYGIAQAARAA